MSMSKLEEKKATIEATRNLIAESKIKEALALLTESVSTYDFDTLVRDEITLLNYRFTNTEKVGRGGTISPEGMIRENNKISQALISLLSDIEKPKEKEKEKSNNRLLLIFEHFFKYWKDYLIAILTFSCLFLLYKVFSPPYFEYTVYIQDNNGSPVLKNEGLITLMAEGQVFHGKVDEYGSAIIRGIPKNFANREMFFELETIYWCPFGLNNNKIKLSNKSTIVKVERTGVLAEVFGLVVDETGEPMKGVKISLENNPDTKGITDGFGKFRFVVPDNLRQKEYRLIIYKDGYKTEAEYYYPDTMAPLMLKLKRK